MKVYVLTSGDYEGYQIVGIFSTFEEAEAVRESQGNRYTLSNEKYNAIEVYDLDRLAGWRWGPTYTAHAESGSLRTMYDRPELRPADRCLVKATKRSVTAKSPVSFEEAEAAVLREML